LIFIFISSEVLLLEEFCLEGEVLFMGLITTVLLID